MLMTGGHFDISVIAIISRFRLESSTLDHFVVLAGLRNAVSMVP
jgi:hypothetical protein